MKRTAFQNLSFALALAMAGTTLCLATPASAAKRGSRDAEAASEEQPAEQPKEAEESKAQEDEQPQEARPMGTTAKGKSDHEKMVGRVGIGWYGVTSVPTGLGNNGASALGVPTIGMRYWFNPGLGLDAALGFAFDWASTETTTSNSTTTTDLTRPYAVVLHAGVPIAITATKHAAFTVTPELKFGWGGSTIPADANIPDDKETVNSGSIFQVGARAGAEVHFGFMNIPNLSLEGSLGLYLTRQSASTEKGDNSASLTETTITTNAFNDPWDFLKATVAARYYF